MNIDKIINEALDNNFGYVSAELIDEDKPILENFYKKLGMEKTIPLDRLHVTLVYDKRNTQSNENEDLSRKYKATIKGVNQLGEPGSKWEAIVFELESKELNKRHEELKSYGFKHSYPEFIAHMSIKYMPKKDDLKQLKENLDKMKDQTLTFQERKWASTKDD